MLFGGTGRRGRQREAGTCGLECWSLLEHDVGVIVASDPCRGVFQAPLHPIQAIFSALIWRAWHPFCATLYKLRELRTLFGAFGAAELDPFICSRFICNNSPSRRRLRASADICFSEAEMEVNSCSLHDMSWDHESGLTSRTLSGGHTVSGCSL